MRVSKKYERLRPVYDHFGREFTDLDFSDGAFEEMYRYESSGGETPDKSNGYFQAKRMIDITVAMWREDLGGLITREELAGEYPDWWLDKVLGGTNGRT